MSGGRRKRSSPPPLYKEYPDSEKVKLPPALPPSDMSLYDSIKKRKSIRSFKDESLTREYFSYLLWASTGICRIQGSYPYRTVPSAGALYPIETYVVVNNVSGIAEGVYHYSVKSHELETLKTGDFGVDAARAALDQEMCAEAAAVFIWTAMFERSKYKYGQRAYRYVYLDAGHIGENLALAASSLGLGCCHIGAIYDDEANGIVDVDGVEESVIYMAVVGVAG
jgi:SagB-type dehydrogenase family enzyme